MFLFLLGFDNNYFQACFQYSAHLPIRCQLSKAFRTTPLNLTSCHSKTQSFNLLLFERLRFMNSAHSGINTSNFDSRKAYISFNQFKITKEFNSVKVLALNFVLHNFSAPIVVWRPLKIFAGGAMVPRPPLPARHCWWGCG